MFSPAASGLVADLAPAGRVKEANSLLSMSQSTAQLIALAAAGALVAAVGPGTAFFVDSATFAASTASLALVRSPALQRPPAGPHWLVGDLREGWAAVRRRPWLVAYTAHVALLNGLVIGPFFVLGPVVAKQHLGGAPAWAAIGIGYALGLLAGSWLTLRWQPARPLMATFAVSTLMAPLLVLLAWPAPIWAIAPAALAAGAQASVYNTLGSSCRQVNVPRELQARTSSIVTLGALVTVPIGMALAGRLADNMGTSTVLALSSAWVLISAAAALAVPSARAPLALKASPSNQLVKR